VVSIKEKYNNVVKKSKKKISSYLSYMKEGLSYSDYFSDDVPYEVKPVPSTIPMEEETTDEKIERLEGFGPIIDQYIPYVDYYMPGSVDLAKAVSKGLENQDCVVLKSHGVVAIGENLDEAALLAEFIEESAKIQFVKKFLNGV